VGNTIMLAEAIAEEPTFLPEGWEIKVVGNGAEMDKPAVGAQLISADETTGEVVAIVGVTGIVDHVNDLIEVGAYRDTLAKRRPKVCWAHDWEKPVGRVPRIEEWTPGDARFAKVAATLDGKPWPAEAGALVAAMQFNMKSERGREAFLAVEFYSETGECEWSIGWQPIPSKTARRKDGVRVCKSVELFEVSPVLFGAAPLTRTLQVKSLRLDDATLTALESKGLPVAQHEDDDDVDENALHLAAKDEIDWAEVEAAADLTDGSAPPPAGQVTLAAKALIPLTGGTDLAELDLDALMAALPPLQAEAKVDEPGGRGNARALIDSYEHGKLAARIRWETPGAFGRCVDIAGKHMTPNQAKGFCNLRSKGATGHYAGEEKSAGVLAGVLAAETLAKTWNPLLEVGVDAAHTERKYMGEGRLRGTFEQRREELDRALTELMRGMHGVSDADSDGPEVSGERGWVSIEGTWEDRVVATWIRFDGPGPDTRLTYEVPYRWNGDVIDLGEPRQVDLQVSVVPVVGEDEVDGDLEEAILTPMLMILGDGSDAMKAALARAPEVKAGRVLSEANIARVRAALEHLLEVARAAGIELPGWTGRDGDPTANAGAPVDTTAPGTAAAAAAPAPTMAVKTLSVESVRADLEGLGNFLS